MRALSLMLTPIETSAGRSNFQGPRMRGTAIAILSILAGEVAAQNLPALKPDPAFRQRWNRCEALARQRGTPPATRGYGDFIDACVRNDAAASGDRKAPERDQTTGIAPPQRHPNGR